MALARLGGVKGRVKGRVEGGVKGRVEGGVKGGVDCGVKGGAGWRVRWGGGRGGGEELGEIRREGVRRIGLGGASRILLKRE